MLNCYYQFDNFMIICYKQFYNEMIIYCRANYALCSKVNGGGTGMSDTRLYN